MTRWLVTSATACRRSATAKTKDGFVSTKDLLQYTQLIVSWKPPIEVLGSVVELVEDVIIGRKDCADFYAAQDAADAGHEAFISALEEILGKLKEARSRQKKEKGAARKVADRFPQETVDGAQKQQAHEALHNLFENLQVEGPSEEAWQAAPAKKDPKNTASSPPVVPTLEVNPDEERRFALFCFLQDMFELRKVIRETWEQARSQKLSYVTATMVTETAFTFMDRAHVKFTEMHPSLCSHAATTEFLGAEFSINPDTKQLFRVKLGTAEMMSGEMVDFLCPKGATLTRHFLSQWD